jgi:ammonia channel protein AmtB
MLESKFGIFDTCGVGNLHGYPSADGALLSVAFIALDAEAGFLRDSMGLQMLRQLGGIPSTLVICIVSGFRTGSFISAFKGEAPPSFKDSVWRHLEYLQ